MGGTNSIPKRTLVYGHQGEFIPMVMELEMMRMLAYRAAKIGDMGLKADRAVTASKLYSNEALFRIANTNLQIHGGNGYSKEFPPERHLRDSRVLMIGEGTTQVMKQLLFRIEMKGRMQQAETTK